MRIAAYCRVSTNHEEQLNSLDNQKRFFQDYAEKEGHTLIKVYSDEGVSGVSLKKRKAFRDLMCDAEQDLFDMVVVKDISRFARNTVDLLQSIRRLKELGINTYFINTNMESMGESEFILTIYAAIAQQESCHISERIKFGKALSAQRGRVPTVIYGYNRIDNYTLEIDPSEALVIRLIFKLYVTDGLGCRSVANQLNERGYKTKKGGAWDSTGIRRILTNAIYCGEYSNHKYEVKDCISGTLVPTPKHTHIIHLRPEWAIIPKHDFEAAQIRLSERGKGKAGKRYSNKALFSNLIVCGECGHSFIHKSVSKDREWGYCRCGLRDRKGADYCQNGVNINEAELYEEILHYLQKKVSTTEEQFADEILARVQGVIQADISACQSLTHEKVKEKMIRKRKKYIAMYEHDMITLQELKEQIEAIDQEENDLERITNHFNVENEKEKIIELINTFTNLHWIRNQDLKELIETITVMNNGDVLIHMKEYSSP